METMDNKTLAITYFNKVWEIIDKSKRTNEDNLQMIDFAHKSLYYWIQAGGTMKQIVRGEWMISHVYSVLGYGEAALYHAKSCFEDTLDHELKDFDLVFAYEAMAYAYKVLGQEDLKKEYLEEGYQAIDQVEKDDDRDYCRSQLDLLK